MLLQKELRMPVEQRGLLKVIQLMVFSSSFTSVMRLGSGSSLELKLWIRGMEMFILGFERVFCPEDCLEKVRRSNLFCEENAKDDIFEQFAVLEESFKVEIILAGSGERFRLLILVIFLFSFSINNYFLEDLPSSITFTCGMNPFELSFVFSFYFLIFLIKFGILSPHVILLLLGQRYQNYPGFSTSRLLFGEKLRYGMKATGFHFYFQALMNLLSSSTASSIPRIKREKVRHGNVKILWSSLTKTIDLRSSIICDIICCSFSTPRAKGFQISLLSKLELIQKRGSFLWLTFSKSSFIANGPWRRNRE